MKKEETQMTKEELKELLENIKKMKCETQTLELKTAAKECPKKLCDTLSSFSNQDNGGVILFGMHHLLCLERYRNKRSLEKTFLGLDMIGRRKG